MRKKISYIFMLIFLVLGTILLAQAAIQTQKSDEWDGIDVDLTKITFKHSVMTVYFKFRNVGTEKQAVELKFGKCYFMDEVNRKKYLLLKDADGTFIAGPIWFSGTFRAEIEPGKSRNMWMKFPEPTDNPETIIIYIPGVPLFEEVRIKK
jgi:hypothetical protein